MFGSRTSGCSKLFTYSNLFRNLLDIRYPQEKLTKKSYLEFAIMGRFICLDDGKMGTLEITLKSAVHVWSGGGIGVEVPMYTGLSGLSSIQKCG